MDLATEELDTDWYFEGVTLISDVPANLFKKKDILSATANTLTFTTLRKEEFDLKVFYLLDGYQKPVTFDQVAFIANNQHEADPILFGVGHELEKLGVSNLFPIANAEGECLVLEIVQRADSKKWCAKIWKPDEHGTWAKDTKFFYNIPYKV